MYACQLFASILLATLAPLAAADEFWVDGAAGSDTNGGRTPGDAWRTITHALASFPSSGGIDRIHVAPGLYDGAHGEAFPLRMPPDLELIGDGGPAATVLESVPAGGNGQAVVLVETCLGCPFDVIGESTVLAGFTLRGGDFGLAVFSDWGASRPTIRDVVIESNGTGIYAGTDFDLGLVRIGGERVLVRGNTEGLRVGGSTLVDLTELVVESNAGTGARASSFPFAWPRLELKRSRITGNGGEGIELAPLYSGAVELVLEDSLVAGNGGAGIDVDETGGDVRPEILRCTIADNQGAGVSLTGQGPPLVLRDSILAGNAPDLAGSFGGASVTRCVIADGTLGNIGSNIAADPRFVEPTVGDYRSGAGSPALDVIPIVAPGAVDLAGNPRGIDGDLDFFGAGDLGALELVTLVLRGDPAPGGTILVDVFAPPGGASIVLLGRGPLLSTPFSSLYGALWLDPFQMARLPTLLQPLGPGPATLPIQFPNVPALAGQTFGVQAVARSPAAPFGGTYTNPVQFTLQ